MSELLSERIIPEHILKIETRIDKNEVVHVDNICRIAEYYEKWKDEIKINKYYEIAMEQKYLKAFYLYGNWLSKTKKGMKMTECFSKAINLYFNKDYYNYSSDIDSNLSEKEKEKQTEYIECIITKMMESLGIYYDNIYFENEDTRNNTIKYYVMAIERGSVNAMFNLGHFYFEKNDLENMFKYYLIAVELGDIDTMYELAIYYQKIRDFDNMRKYYLMALETSEKPDHKDNVVNNGEDDFDLFILKEELEKIEDKPVYLINRIQKLNCIRDIMIYENKKKLFSQLNHIVECCICYETKLNINLFCGHCVCTSCYSRLYQSPCPICRI
jgi:TPR repeat protein